MQIMQYKIEHDNQNQVRGALKVAHENSLQYI